MQEPLHHQLTNCLHFHNDAEPGCLSRIQIFSIPDPGSASNNLGVLTQKIVSNLSEIWSGCSSRIRILTFYPSRIWDPGVQREPDPGSESSTLMVFYLPATNAKAKGTAPVNLLVHLSEFGVQTIDLCLASLCQTGNIVQLQPTHKSTYLGYRKDFTTKTYLIWLAHVLCPSSSGSPLL